MVRAAEQPQRATVLVRALLIGGFSLAIGGTLVWMLVSETGGSLLYDFAPNNPGSAKFCAGFIALVALFFAFVYGRWVRDAIGGSLTVLTGELEPHIDGRNPKRRATLYKIGEQQLAILGDAGAFAKKRVTAYMLPRSRLVIALHHAAPDDAQI